MQGATHQGTTGHPCQKAPNAQALRQCNEVHPQCLNCERHEIACSFSAPSLTTTPLHDDSFADLELLDHWHRWRSTSANALLPSRESENDAIRLGFSHHYLLNSILAFAALQLFNEDRSQTRWYVRAVAHRQAAIARARPHLQNLQELQHLALLNFSFYTSIYALAEPLVRAPTTGCLHSAFDPVKELLQAIRLGRSSAVFVQQHLASAVSSNQAFVGKYGTGPLKAVQGLEFAFPQLVSLQRFIESQCEGWERSVCLRAAELLSASFACLVKNPDGSAQTRATWGWASHVDSAYLDLCFAQNTVALVIFAHFAALLSLSRGSWYLRSWPPLLLRHIRSLLKDGLEESIRWPEETVFGKRLTLLSTA